MNISFGIFISSYYSAIAPQLSPGFRQVSRFPDLVGERVIPLQRRCMVLKRKSWKQIKIYSVPSKIHKQCGPKCVKGSEEFCGQGQVIFSAADIVLIPAIESLVQVKTMSCPAHVKPPPCPD